MPVISAASCTTNAIVPALKVVEDTWGIVHGHIETVHSYTNDQNLLDNYHSKQRRGRAAPINMVLTETGAAKAVSKAVPSLKGKLSASAIRVPTPNVSMAVCSLELEKDDPDICQETYLSSDIHIVKSKIMPFLVAVEEGIEAAHELHNTVGNDLDPQNEIP